MKVLVRRGTSQKGMFGGTTVQTITMQLQLEGDEGDIINANRLDYFLLVEADDVKDVVYLRNLIDGYTYEDELAANLIKQRNQILSKIPGLVTTIQAHQDFASKDEELFEFPTTDE